MNSTTLNAAEIRLRNAEQFLGSKRKRYFASGYKKIDCELSNYQYSDDILTTSLKLNWGNNWSTRNTGPGERHLGSIESSLVALCSLELYLIIKYNLTDEEIATSFIRKIEFTTKPCNHDMDQVFDVKVTNVNTDWSDFITAIGRFEIIVENFHFTIEIDFSNHFKSIGFPYERFSKAITFNPEQYYNHGYKSTSIDIENLVLNLETRSVIAVSKVKRSLSSNIIGIGTSDLRGLTFIDFLSIAGQLTQILLYSLENTTREESNNMWVRSLSAVFYSQNPQVEFISKAYFTRFNLVEMKDEIWRTATAKFEIGSISGSAKVCHIINT